MQPAAAPTLPRLTTPPSSPSWTPPTDLGPRGPSTPQPALGAQGSPTATYSDVQNSLEDTYRQNSGGQPPSVQSASPFSSDPAYAAATAAEQLGIPSIDNNLMNLINQRIVAYGDPSLAAQAGFGLDSQAAAFARQNYLSGNGQLARLDKAHEQARRTIINQLAAHGLLDSGDTGYQVGGADQTYGNSVYDAQQQALADILGYRNSAQSQRDALHNAKVAALENAYQWYIDHPAAAAATTPTTPAPAAAQPATASIYGGSVNAAATSLGKQVGAAARKTMQQLANPYVTGQKRFG
jgi:hypothetical protein